MGNTNIPQAGAADTQNSRDTLSGDEQLTDAEKWERDHAGKSRGVGPAPSRPKNAQARIPGQQLDAADAAVTPADPADRSHAGDELAADDPHNPRNTTGAGNPAPLRSHVHTGHSASDAT